MQVGLQARRPAKKSRVVPITAGAIVLFALALVRSAVICLRRVPDADMATVPLVSEAVHRHGLSVLAAWHYTQDNWLLSVIIPELWLQPVLHPAPWLPALTGWLFFVGNCVLAAMLALPAVGRTAALLLAATLMVASPGSLTGFGFLAHPTSHDVTTFWCLGATLLIMACLRGRSSLLLLPAAVALFVATVSDPWAKAAFLLPLGAGAFLATLLSGGRIRRIAPLVMVATLPSWLAGDHLFGLMPTLTAQHFERGPVSAIPAHLRVGVLGIGRLLGVDGILPSHGTLASLAILCGLVLLAIGALARRPAQLRDADGMLMLVCLLSVAGTLSAFAVSALPADIGLTRLLLNAYFALPLFLCVALLAMPSRTGRVALTAAACLFVASGLCQGWQPLREQSVGAPGWQTRLTDFLKAHDLHEGYGGYWGSDANSSRVRTDDIVTIRPVTAAGGRMPIRPDGSQTFDSWYDDTGDADGATDTAERFFVAIPDPELCADPQSCKALAIRSFGPPEKILDWEGHAILVWSHPLRFDAPPPATLAALPAPGGSPVSGAALIAYLWSGWSLPDPGGSWMYGHAAVLMLPATTAGQCLTLRAASGPEGGPTQPLLLLDGATRLALWHVPPGVATRHCIPAHPAAETVRLEHDGTDDARSAPILLSTLSTLSTLSRDALDPPRAKP